MDLALIWGFIIAIAVFVYVALDGFDLGVGILFPLLRDEGERDTAIGAIAPVWDGNETWLILGGGGLFAVFPLAYAVIFPALYVPLIVMLLALVFRGVAFEYRVHSGGHKWFWEHAFFGGSIVAAFAQGIALGAWLQGIDVVGRAYDGDWWDWVSPFSITTGLALVFGYAMLGAAWINLKTEGALHERGADLHCAACGGHNCLHRHRQPMDTIFERAICRPLVHAADDDLCDAGTAVCWSHRIAVVAGAETGLGTAGFPRDRVPFPALLHRPRHFRMAGYRADKH